MQVHLMPDNLASIAHRKDVDREDKVLEEKEAEVVKKTKSRCETYTYLSAGKNLKE